jgi:hypothetical protein
MGVVYGIVGLLIITRRNLSHRVKIYHGQAYIDCAVDGDSDPNTCVSDYTVEKTFTFNAGYSFGTSLLLSSFFHFVQAAVHEKHHYSKVSYLDALLSTSLMTFSIAVITGSQGLSALILMILNTIMYEVGIYVHDMEFWKGLAVEPYQFRIRYLMLISLNATTLGVNVAALIEYWSVSHIPVFIPLIGVSWYLQFIMLRFFTYRYFYATLPSIIRSAQREERSMFKSGDVDRFHAIRKEDQYVIDWFDSWKGGISFFFKIFVTLIFYVGTNAIQITYV